jgi:DNA modification methylase
MNSLETEGRTLVDHSWDFEKADTKYSNHGFHSYPAMMIPQVARRLIEEYGNGSKTLLDPFMGSGTAVLEAKLNPNFENAYGVDINPLALLVGKVKTTPIDYELLKTVFMDVLDESNDELQQINFMMKKKETKDVDFFNINYWFKPNTISELAILKNNINKIENGDKRIERDLKDFFDVVLSEIARKCSNTRNGEYKLYRLSEDQLKKFNPKPILEFENKGKKNIERMKTFNRECGGCEVHILSEDSRLRTSIGDDSVDLLITSPPYGDSQTTVAYGQFSRLSLQWLGYDKKEVTNIDKMSLGGKKLPEQENMLDSPALKDIIHKISEKDEKRAKTVLDFYMDFYKCVEEFDRVMKTGSKLCFVVGNRTVKGFKIPTDRILIDLFKQKDNQYRHLETIIRRIPSKRLPKKNSPTNIKGEVGSMMNDEYIVILEKR